MIAPGLKDIAERLQRGEIEPHIAGRILTAQAEGVATLEERAAKIELAVRNTVLNGIGFTTALAALENEIPRETKEVDAICDKP